MLQVFKNNAIFKYKKILERFFKSFLLLKFFKNFVIMNAIEFLLMLRLNITRNKRVSLIQQAFAGSKLIKICCTKQIMNV